jgi:hypothetical protein
MLSSLIEVVNGIVAEWMEIAVGVLKSTEGRWR